MKSRKVEIMSEMDVPDQGTLTISTRMKHLKKRFKTIH